MFWSAPRTGDRADRTFDPLPDADAIDCVKHEHGYYDKHTTVYVVLHSILYNVTQNGEAKL